MGKASYKIRETKNMRHFTYSGNLEDAIEKAKGDYRKKKKIRKLRNGIGCTKKPKKPLTHIIRKLPTLRRLYGAAEEEQEKQKGKKDNETTDS